MKLWKPISQLTNQSTYSLKTNNFKESMLSVQINDLFIFQFCYDKRNMEKLGNFLDLEKSGNVNKTCTILLNLTISIRTFLENY